jgi:hypothetical protein
MPRELAKFRVLDDVRVKGATDRERRRYRAGSEFYFAGVPGNSLLALNGAARSAKLRAIVAELATAGSADSVSVVLSVARGLGFEGADPYAAETFTKNFIEIETALQPSSTKGK